MKNIDSIIKDMETAAKEYGEKSYKLLAAAHTLKANLYMGWIDLETYRKGCQIFLTTTGHPMTDEYLEEADKEYLSK